jgi:hypothetical protein
MDIKLKEIQFLSDQLSKAISEYLTLIETDRIVIVKSQFHNIKLLGKLNSYVHVFDYCNGLVFTLPDSGNSYQYEKMHFLKLMSGELEQIVLNKKNPPVNQDKYIINYELEPAEKTRLFNLYPN